MMLAITLAETDSTQTWLNFGYEVSGICAKCR
jgi:hypothetical protein